jgi:hypothetical protein
MGGGIVINNVYNTWFETMTTLSSSSVDQVGAGSLVHFYDPVGGTTGSHTVSTTSHQDYQKE